MTDAPDISVIIPVRNGARYIGEALRSVLRQDGVSLEVVVVDDGSSDETPRRIAAVADADATGRVRVVPGPGQGVARAMNAGLAVVRGRYIARCDSDDCYPPGRLAAQRAILEQRSGSGGGGGGEYGAVCGRFQVLDGSGRRVYQPPAAGNAARDLTRDLRMGRVDVHLCTYLVRREPMLATGGFRPYFRTGSDIDFQLRLCERTRVWYEPVTWYGYRFHDASLTHRHSRRLRQFNESIARAFQCQRAARGSGGSGGGGDEDGTVGPDDLDLGRPPPPPPPELEEEAMAEGDRSSAKEQLWQMRWGDAWREHADGRRVRGVLVGVHATLQRPWRPVAWRRLAALCVKSTPLWHPQHQQPQAPPPPASP